ncbi:hypothetical protein ACYFX5_01155 [Bremerella sp. T1]|uniref:hypothetical protein n=1 Tax=Bremerella sp. TYQ1 TaxID=3119568 RepID=UPI001CCB1BE1|nr:hypothetical protein [Bremerella volcania]UBM36897.1 hypothetical protein LA756_03115 [Bremerella volcania]
MRYLTGWLAAAILLVGNVGIIFAQPPANDPEARIDELLTYHRPVLDQYLSGEDHFFDGKTFSQLPSELSRAIENGRATTNDPNIVASLMKILTSPAMHDESRLHYLYTVAGWQHAAGNQTAAHQTLRDAAQLLLQLRQQPDYSLDNPICGISTAQGERLAYHMVTLGSPDADVLLAKKIAGPSRTYQTSGACATHCAEKGRHELAQAWIDWETDAGRHLHSLASVAMAYFQSGDIPRGKEFVEQMLLTLNADDFDADRNYNLDACQNVIVTLHQNGEIELAEQLMDAYEKRSQYASSSLWYAGGLLVIGENERAEKVIDQFVATYEPTGYSYEASFYTFDEETRLVIAKAHTLSQRLAFYGMYDEAIELVERIPETKPQRLDLVSKVCNQMLADGTAESRAFAVEVLTRNAPHAVHISKIPEQSQQDAQTYLLAFATTLGEAGAWDVLDKTVVPELSEEHAKRLTRHLRWQSDNIGLSLPEKLARFVTPVTDPVEKFHALASLRHSTKNTDEKRKLFAMMRSLPGDHAEWLAGTLTTVASEQYAAGDINEAEQTWAEARAEIDKIASPTDRADTLRSLAISTWLSGQSKLARQASEDLANLLWEIRDQEIDRLAITKRYGLVEDAKLLLTHVSKD